MLRMRGGSQVGNNGVKMARPPPVPPRPDRSLVADALSRSRKVPAPVLPPGLQLTAPAPAPSPQDAPKPNTNKLPSPKLNGLSRVKSFIRDVMNEKKNSDDKKSSKDKDENINHKNGTVKSHIPIPQSPKTKNPDHSLNFPQEESVRNLSSQSVVRSLCSVLMNSDKDKSTTAGDPKPAVRVVKSNSFAEKAIPVRRAPPPPISPKPTKKQIEDRSIARSQGATDGISLRKLSASCEELNNSISRPIVYQSSTSKLSSPMFFKKSIPPSLPSGKPAPPVRKIGYPSSPTSVSNSIDSLFFKKSGSIEHLDNASKKNAPKTDHADLSFCEIENKRLTEKLISEIISAKNDALLSKFENKLPQNGKIGAETLIQKSTTHVENSKSSLSKENMTNDINIISSCKDDRINLVNISYQNTYPKPHKDSVSSCSSDSSGTTAGKTILFINSDTPPVSGPVTRNELPAIKTVQSITNKIKSAEADKDHPNDKANIELLIAELEDMRREAFNGRVNKRQRQPSSELGSSSPDSISAETQNIQHSDWVQVEDNGQQVRYSSCQIVIEDPSSPIDDSGIGLDDIYSTENSYSLSPSLVSRLKEQYYANLKMSSLQGLPPLPKSLSGFNVAEGGPGQPPPPGQAPPPPVPARTPASLRYSQGGRPGEPTAPSPAPIPVQNGDTHRQARKPTTLDTQLAVLKREMLSLRQLDLSLLSQLWSLNESIHEFRQYMGPGAGVGGDQEEGDEGDDSSSGGEDPRPPPQRGRTPI